VAALIALLLLGGAAPPHPDPPASGHTLEPRTLDRDPDYVIVRGALLGDLLGRDIRTLRLHASRAGRLAPIPFQIDERDPQGRLVCPLGRKPERDVDNGLLDENDELVFMASDSGDRIAPAARPADWIAFEELEIRDPLNGKKGWCYLVAAADPGPLSEIEYIKYYPEEDRYEALYNSSVYMRDGINRADYHVNIYPPEAGGTGVDITDRLKIRVATRLKAPPVTLRFHEDDMEVETLAYIDGPIRIVRRNQLYLRVPFVTIPFGGAHDVIIYRDTNDTPMEVSVPRGTSWLVQSLQIRLGTDFSPEAVGMIWYNKYNPEGVLVDGRMSPQEKRLDLRLDREDREVYWQVITGPQGTMMRRGYYHPDLKDVLETSIEYLDDIGVPDPPEAFPGRIGNAFLSLNLTSVKSGTYTFHQQWYHPHHFYPFRMEGVQRYMNIINHPLEVRTKHGRQ